MRVNQFSMNISDEAFDLLKSIADQYELNGVRPGAVAKILFYQRLSCYPGWGLYDNDFHKRMRVISALNHESLQKLDDFIAGLVSETGKVNNNPTSRKQDDVRHRKSSK